MFYDGDCLSPKRVLQAVGDKARHILVAEAWLLADPGHKVHDSLCGFVGGRVCLYNLYQRNQMTRIPEMRAAEAFPMLEVTTDFGRTHDRGVCAENTIRSAALFQLCESLAFEVHILKDCFDHQIRILHARAVEISGEVDSRKAFRKLCF